MHISLRTRYLLEPMLQTRRLIEDVSVALQVLVDSGDFKGADDALSRLNKVSADCTHGRLLSAKMYLKEGNYEKVSWEAGRLLKNEPSNVQALLMRGEAFFYLEVRNNSKASADLCQPVPWLQAILKFYTSYSMGTVRKHLVLLVLN